MNVRYHKSFQRDLSKVDDSDLLLRVENIIERVKGAETLQQIPNLRKLTGTRSLYRIRIGDYRIGMELRDGVLWFVRFLHRKDVYRDFS